MASRRFSVSTPNGGVAVAKDGNPHTVLQVTAPSSQDLLIEHFHVGFRGVVPTDPPCQIALVRQTSGSGAGSSAVSPTIVDSNPNAPRSTGAQSFTTEPTAGNILYSDTVQPQLSGGASFPISQQLFVPQGTSLGVVVNIPAGSSASNTVSVTMICQE